MAVDVKSEKLTELVDPNVEIEQLGTGFTFTEGPIWHPTEHHLLFSDMPGDVRRKWSADGGVVEMKNFSNKCNGMTYDADLNLLVCEHVTSCVVRESPDGSREMIAQEFEGEELNSPNDVVVHSSGAIYFTDPWYGRMPGFGHPRKRRLGFQGVYRIPPGGGDLELVVGRDEFEMPNGLCFSPDESLLYINDTPGAFINVYDVNADGTLANGRMLRRGDRHGRPRGRRARRRHEVRRAGQHLGDRARRDLGLRLGRRAPRCRRDPRERRQPRPGAGPTGTRSSCPRARRSTRFKTKVGPRREPYMR